MNRTTLVLVIALVALTAANLYRSFDDPEAPDAAPAAEAPPLRVTDDRVIRRFDPHHFRAHRHRAAGDLIDRLAAYPKRHQQAAHLRRGRIAGHHDVEGGFCLVEAHRLA